MGLLPGVFLLCIPIIQKKNKKKPELFLLLSPLFWQQRMIFGLKIIEHPSMKGK